MSVYDRPIAAARRMIDKYGEECVWSEQAQQADNDTATPWIDQRTGEAVGTPVKIAFFPVGGDSSLAAVLASLTDAPETAFAKEYGLMPGDVAFEPTLDDTLVDSNGKPIEVVRITPLRPGGVVVLYKIWVER